jgi:predicted transcriptional regulator/DNA-binding XRE family transcriptional regulator
MSRARTPIGARIKRKRIAAGLSQAALAQALGISASYLNLIENNKRAIGGTLLLRIGDRLGIDLETLSGDSEARTIATINELMGDSVMKGIDMDADTARDLVARFPEGGAALARLYRAMADANAEIDVLQHRLKSDPLLSELLHSILNRIAGIKSGAEILEGIADLTEEERRRFIATINSEARELVPSMQSLADYFDQSAARQKRFSPILELDEAIIAHNNHFPALEDAARALRAEIEEDGQLKEETIAMALERRFGVACRTGAAREARQQDGAEDSAVLTFPEFMPRPSRIFRMLRLYALRAAGDVIGTTLAGLEMTSDEARALARRALSSYVAGAVMMPYESFLAMAEERRYDAELMSDILGVSFEQVAHRFVTLRRKGSEGVPFGFLRADNSGRLTKRFPLPGFSVPGFGHGCLLWPVYTAFFERGLVRQVCVFPGGGRFLLVAKATARRVAGLERPPLVLAIMLACDIVHADRTVYGRGLDLGQPPVEVGPSCMLCPRLDCSHRQTIPV